MRIKITAPLSKKNTGACWVSARLDARARRLLRLRNELENRNNYNLRQSLLTLWTLEFHAPLCPLAQNNVSPPEVSGVRPRAINIAY